VPVARYFVVVGSALLVLLLIAGWSLPEPSASSLDRPEIIDRAIIRIRSERRWPEKVVLDTNQPAFSPLSTEAAPSQQSVEPLPDEMTDQTSVDALATPNTSPRPIVARRRPVRAKHKFVGASPSTHVVRTRGRNEQPTLGTDEECRRFEWADKPALSKPASRNRVARRPSRVSWHFPEAD
jgi:hypothetical protein